MRQFFGNKLAIFWQLFGIFLIIGCQSVPPSPDPISPPCFVEKLSMRPTGRTIFFNKKDFIKKPGLRVVPDATILSALGVAVDAVEQMPYINGYVLKPKPGVRVMSSREGVAAGWISSPEYEYKIEQVSCQKVTPIPCPTNPNPVPQCPSPPGSGPCSPTDPVDPGPIEVAKSWGLTRVRAMEAKALVDTSNVKIGILDTGIDLQHPCNGVVFYQKDYSGKGTVQDGAGHGTHVAGTIAGKCGVGISKAKLAIGKGLSDAGSGTTTALGNGMVDLCNQGIQAMNNSWGGGGVDAFLNQATDYCVSKGVTMFFANGNDGGPVNNPAKQAGTKKPKVRAVAASGQNNLITSFSSRGPETTDIAPGAGIISNWPGGGSRSLDGTSMATPHAVGVCAYGLAKGKNPCIVPNGTVSGYPMVDALSAAQ